MLVKKEIINIVGMIAVLVQGSYKNSVILRERLNAIHESALFLKGIEMASNFTHEGDKKDKEINRLVQ